LKKIEITVRKNQIGEIEEAFQQMELLFIVSPIKIDKSPA